MYMKPAELIGPPSMIERLWQDVCVAVGFLTVLPFGSLVAAQPDLNAEEEVDDMPASLTASPTTASGLLARATSLFPLVGIAIGTVGALTLLAAFHIGLHPLACALLALVASIILTGGLHEDGLAGGGRTIERRLAIMHDSHLGTFGVLALVFGIGIRASILTGVFSPDTAALTIIAGATLSRAVLPGMMRWLPPARVDGLAAAAGRPEPTQIAIATLIAVVTALLTLGFWGAMSALAAAIVAAVIVGLIARKMIGGQTGDVLGMSQVVVEMAVLAAAAATVGGG